MTSEKEKEKLREYNKNYYHKTRKHKIDWKKEAERTKKWQISNPEQWKKLQNCSRYKMSHEEYDDMMESTGDSCPICNYDFNEGRYKRNIDHCHDTGYVRGIICHRCNLAIGALEHDVSIFERAIEWLKRKPTDGD